MRNFWTSVFSRGKGKQAKNHGEYMGKIDPERLPAHLAIIMDGNGRWAQKRGLPRTVGHRAGMEALRRVIVTCDKLKIPVLTVYAFSTENWKRPKTEVSLLMNLIVEFLRKDIAELHAKKVRIQSMGNIAEIPEEARLELENAFRITKDNTGLIFNVAINYGGRKEILEAACTLADEIATGAVAAAEVTEESFAQYLLTRGLPDPDLLIRPSGEFRISNFLLWQLAYAELYFTETLWPDFNEEEIIKAIIDFQKRSRRFGGI